MLQYQSRLQIHSLLLYILASVTAIFSKSACSQHLHFVHAAGLGDVGLAGEDGLLHATHILALRGECLRVAEADVVDDTLPRVIALSMFLDERVVLFFLNHIVGAALFNLPVALGLPPVQVRLRFDFAILLLLHFLFLFLIELEFPLLICLVDLGHERLLLVGPVLLVLPRWLLEAPHREVGLGVECVAGWLRLHVLEPVVLATAKIPEVSEFGHCTFIN